jgi:hypothetical protein
VQLTEQEPGLYDKRHPGYARRDKIVLAWERISHEMEESGMCVCVCVCVYIYIYIITTTYNRIQIQNMSAKAMQTATTVWPRAVYCIYDTRSLRKSDLSCPIEQNINQTQKRELFQALAKYLRSMAAGRGRCKLFKYKFQV